MNGHETTATTAGTITNGFDRLRRSLAPHQRANANYSAAGETPWNSRFVASAVPTDRRTLAEFDYREHELVATDWGYDDTAMVGPIQLLTPDGTTHLNQICTDLRTAAVDNDYVVTRRLRNVEEISPFVYDMVRDPALLRLVSSIVGVELVPHPIRDAGVQINYYTTARAGQTPQVAKWHIDGMNYVFTMTLTDHQDHDGGDYIYYQGHRSDFELHQGEIAAAGATHPRVATAPFTRAGDTMFTRGSHVYHAVTPLTRGDRITFAMSFFCPTLGHEDENRFWHSAPDDGLLRTARNWVSLARAVRKPTAYKRRNDIPAVPVSPQAAPSDCQGTNL